MLPPTRAYVGLPLDPPLQLNVLGSALVAGPRSTVRPLSRTRIACNGCGPVSSVVEVTAVQSTRTAVPPLMFEDESSEVGDGHSHVPACALVMPDCVPKSSRARLMA